MGGACHQTYFYWCHFDPEIADGQSSLSDYRRSAQIHFALYAWTNAEYTATWRLKIRDYSCYSDWKRNYLHWNSRKCPEEDVFDGFCKFIVWMFQFAKLQEEIQASWIIIMISSEWPLSHVHGPVRIGRSFSEWALAEWMPQSAGEACLRLLLNESLSWMDNK